MPLKTDLPFLYFAADNDGDDLRQLCPNVKVVNILGGHWDCITTHVDALAHEIRIRLQALESRTP